MESKKALEEKEALEFLRRFKKGEFPIEYIPNGFRLDNCFNEINILILNYDTINEKKNIIKFFVLVMLSI